MILQQPVTVELVVKLDGVQISANEVRALRGDALEEFLAFVRGGCEAGVLAVGRKITESSKEPA